MAGPNEQRIYSLDVLRGCAALITLLWHYQHFFYMNEGHLAANFKVDSQPLYSIFSLFYLHGHRRVDVFFVLSGFIMFDVYLRRIGSGEVGLRKFSLLRVSRLYPLHLLTLALVAVMQSVSYAADAHHIVYQFNDLKHFLLQLCMASDWGFQSGFSFNGPVWSVSVEVLLYASFFAFAALSPADVWIRAVLACSIALACYAFGAQFLSDMVAHALVCFYCGGLACLAYQWLRTNAAAMPFGAGLAGLVGVLSLAYYVRNFAAVSEAPILGAIVFPCFVLNLALLQTQLPSMGRTLGQFGDVTYALLLVHFPIQLAVLLYCKVEHVVIDFTAPLALVGFAAVSIATAFAAHYLFELPCQRWLRSSLVTQAPRSVPVHTEIPAGVIDEGWLVRGRA